MFDRKEYMKKYLEKHKEELKERSKKYREEHKEELKERSKKYIETHKEKINERNKKWYKENKEKRREYNKKYRKEHKEEIKKYREKNREKNRESSKNWALENPEKVKNHCLLHTYGITLEQKKDIIRQQNNKCAGCGINFDETTWHTKPVVDHDHKTGENRSLLCHHCNWALGNTKDNPETLRNLANYVEKYRSKEVKR